jgi:hypothetical protein
MKIRLILRYLFYKLIKPTKTDQITFKVSTEIDDEECPWDHTDIIINQKSLFERLKEYELGEASRTKTNRDLAGKYIGIDPHALFRNVLTFKKGKFSAWQCSECRSQCAAHLYCTVKVGLFFVYWYDFRQVASNIPFNRSESIHEVMREKTKWNYEPFQSFKFNKRDFFNKARLLHTNPERFK